MKKVVTVVGARPQFIKAAVVSRELRKEYHEVMIHTGQHYDYNMSDIFFQELDIPLPDYNLGVSGGTHGKMTGEMLIKIEEVLMKEKPDFVLLYGDTNSTLAGALAAVKLHIPVFHVEAGNRFGTLDSPEEVNRITTDHLSTLCFPCTESSREFLVKEGLGNHSFVIGDPMYDAFCYYHKEFAKLDMSHMLNLRGEKVILPSDFYYMTCHRQENTDTDDKLASIFEAMNRLDCPTIYPVHPRNQERAIQICENKKYDRIILIAPVGYKESIYLVSNAKKIVTDSGGVQREAFFAKKPCVTILDFVVWPETMVDNCNQLAKPDQKDILDKLKCEVHFGEDYYPFGKGDSSEVIVKLIGDFFADKIQI